MILNMPVTNGAVTSMPSESQSEYCDFLKRKYPDNDISHANNQSSSEQISSYQENNNNSVWKKRHIEESSYEMPVIASSTYITNHHSPSSSQDYTHRGGTQTPIGHTDTSTATGTFNLIANSSSFINDLFAYDASLLGHVSSSVSSASLGDNVLCHTEPIFTTPSTICVNTTHQFDEDNADNWQASDLLELDHRYNSSLQTEITQLNPTVSLKPHEESLVSLADHQNNSTPQQTQDTQFLQTPRSPTEIKTTDAEADFEDRNLSWLLNFKFDEFPHLNPDVARANAKSLKSQQNNGYAAASAANYKTNGSPTNHINGSLSRRERSKSPKNSNKTGKKFEELVMEATGEMDGNEMIVAENVVIEDTSVPHRAPKKPPFTYTELIEYALEDKGELTVSGIYQWISDRFPYYKSNDDRWKNSVRHNLSINPHFRKGHKAPQGAGHLWTISSGDSAENVLAWEHKKQRLDLFFKMESMNRERLAQHQQQMQQQQQALNASALTQQQHKHIGCHQDQCLYDEAAVAAAAIQQEMLQQQVQCSSSNKDVTQHQHHANHNSPHPPSLHDLPYNELLSEEELRKTAGQILNGIHRDVEVQSVNHQSIISTYQDVLLDNEDYLNPVHKDVAVNESGLRHITSTISSANSQCHSTTTPYYVTEIDPMELGIQMSPHSHTLTHSHTHNSHLHQHHSHHNNHHHHHGNDHPTAVVNGEDAVLFNDEFNLNYFTYNPATDIVA